MFVYPFDECYYLYSNVAYTIWLQKSIFLKPEMKQRILSHFQDYLFQYISHQYQDILYCIDSSQYILMPKYRMNLYYRRNLQKA
jgi:hypothetical protein